MCRLEPIYVSASTIYRLPNTVILYSQHVAASVRPALLLNAAKLTVFCPSGNLELHLAVLVTFTYLLVFPLNIPRR